MKQVFQFVISLLLCASVVQAQDTPKTWALIVGVGSYTNPQLTPLRFAAKDALSMRDAFLAPDLGGLPANQVKFLADNTGTRANIEGAVRQFFIPNVKDGDKIVVFLAGHGIAKGAGTEAKSYFLPYDTKGVTLESLQKSAVDLRAFADELGTLPASQFVVFVDACREDPTPGRGIKGNTMTDVMSRSALVVPDDSKANSATPGKPVTSAKSATFFACSPGQRAYEDAKLGHGVFTNWIIKGLKEGVNPQPDGDLDMDALSEYVSREVEAWAKQTSAAGDFEVEQKPELITARTATTVVEPKTIVLLQVKRKPSTQNRETTSPKPADLPVDPNDPGADSYYNAVKAESRQKWDEAEKHYKDAIGKSPKLVPAHDALGELHRLQGRNADAIADALNLHASVSGVHALSALSRAYSRYTQSGPGTGNTATSVKTYKVKSPLLANAEQARFSAINAAKDAVAADANSAEAHRAYGYAWAALDTEGKNKKDALAAFAKATALNEADAENYLGLGYGLRYYGAQQKDEAAKKGEMESAIENLERAVKLRPNYYDAHRELAFCHTMLGNTEAALKSVEKANGNRGAAGDVGEIVALEVAAAGMHQKAAEEETDPKKKDRHEKASEGYMADAKEKDPELKTALKILNMVGLGYSIYSLLPDNARKVLDPKGTLNAEKNKLIDKSGLGGLRGKFGF